MFLDVFDRNPFGTNCWMLGAEGSEEAVVVDPGFEPARLRSMLEAVGRRPVAVLLTHAHSDHAEAAGDYAGEDLPVFIHPADAVAYDDIEAWDPQQAMPSAAVRHGDATATARVLGVLSEVR